MRKLPNFDLRIFSGEPLEGMCKLVRRVFQRKSNHHAAERDAMVVIKVLGDLECYKHISRKYDSTGRSSCTPSFVGGFGVQFGPGLLGHEEQVEGDSEGTSEADLDQ